MHLKQGFHSLLSPPPHPMLLKLGTAEWRTDCGCEFVRRRELSMAGRVGGRREKEPHLLGLLDDIVWQQKEFRKCCMGKGPGSPGKIPAGIALPPRAPAPDVQAIVFPGFW